uniref:Ciliary microtubule inner protein 5 n=1 Tax=Leptobrachium leishanense TaxID=445787 RepID=A0A8C5QJM2_9ANUR
MSSKPVSIRRTTSAGYRLPDRRPAHLETNSTSSLNKTHPGARQNPPLGARDKDKATWEDAVRSDHVWRELVESEKRGEKRWDEQWGFLKEYDALGNKKEPDILPEEAFSENMPSTTSQIMGSRINTELGKSLSRMDYILTGGNQKRKLGNELAPC